MSVWQILSWTVPPSAAFALAAWAKAWAATFEEEDE